MLVKNRARNNVLPTLSSRKSPVARIAFFLSFRDGTDNARCTPFCIRFARMYTTVTRDRLHLDIKIIKRNAVKKNCVLVCVYLCVCACDLTRRIFSPLSPYAVAQRALATAFNERGPWEDRARGLTREYMWSITATTTTIDGTVGRGGETRRHRGLPVPAAAAVEQRAARTKEENPKSTGR